MRAGRLLPALAVAAALAPARASADNLVNTEVIAVGAVGAALDVGLLVYDLALVARDQHPTRAAASAELTLMSVQLVMGVSIIASLGTHASYVDPSGNVVDASPSVALMAPIGALLSLMAIPLGVHALWGLSHPAPDPPQRASLLLPGLSVGPRQALVTLSGTF
jgi:hypothetical protein